MEKQFIITIAREFGSGGSYLAELLSKHYNIPVYHHNLIDEQFKEYDEKKKSMFFSRTVRGFSNSPEDILANKQFDFLKKEAAEGKSFIVIGHCADCVLKDYPNLIRLFISGNFEEKVLRSMNRENVEREEAMAMMKRFDQKRKSYYNYYSHSLYKWGDARNYDLVINSSILGMDITEKFLIDYIDLRLKNAK